MKKKVKLVLDGDLGWKERDKPTSENTFTPDQLADYLKRHLPIGWAVKDFRVEAVRLKPVKEEVDADNNVSPLRKKRKPVS